MVRIDGERLLEDLETLSGFGRSGTGVVRQVLSEVDIASRHPRGALWLSGPAPGSGSGAVEEPRPHRRAAVRRSRRGTGPGR